MAGWEFPPALVGFHIVKLTSTQGSPGLGNPHGVQLWVGHQLLEAKVMLKKTPNQKMDQYKQNPAIRRD